MEFPNLAIFKEQMNTLGQGKVPFLFVVDFELQKPILVPLAQVDRKSMLYSVNGNTNSVERLDKGTVTLQKFPDDFNAYKAKFDQVLSRLSYGDSFLTNLTVRTEVKLSHSLRDLFLQTNARYKLLIDDQFLVFSPERFVEITNGVIRSFPMKGTIDAAIADAEKKILADQKELSEHVTIVDLIRNDLSQVAQNVRVDRFRYIEEVRTSEKTLLQVSSLITGQLDDDYRSKLGDILVALLPAGSISGAPKKKTIDIICEVEKETRGYYTGVFGIFDGMSLDSGVMIRFIERRGNKYYYRSGGGITTQSVAKSEYQEVIDKVYVPVT